MFEFINWDLVGSSKPPIIKNASIKTQEIVLMLMSDPVSSKAIAYSQGGKNDELVKFVKTMRDEIQDHKENHYPLDCTWKYVPPNFDQFLIYFVGKYLIDPTRLRQFIYVWFVALFFLFCQ